MKRRSVAFLAALVLSAGCVGLGIDGGSGDGTPADGIGDGATPAVGPTVTVTDVIDGDTVDVRYDNGTNDRIRLLGIDTPEVHAENDPAEYEDVPDTDAGRACLREVGRNASTFVESRLAGADVSLAFDPYEDRRDRYDRLLAYVALDGEDVNYRLVQTGHARVYDTRFARSEAYYEAESEAMEADRGVWRCRSGASRSSTETSDTGLVVAEVHADAAGNDHENLNDEYVVFRNDGDEPLDLGGWRVADEGGHSYVFPEGVSLAPGETATLRSGSGSDGEAELYWNADSAIWNNDGDTIRVYDTDGRLVLERSYS